MKKKDEGFFGKNVAKHIIISISIFLMVLIFARAIMKAIYISPDSELVAGFYSLTDIFLFPIHQVVPKLKPIETQGPDIELASLVAIMVYPVLAFLIIWVIGLLRGSRD